MGGAGSRSAAGLGGPQHFQEEARTPTASRQERWAVLSEETGHMTRAGTAHPLVGGVLGGGGQLRRAEGPGWGIGTLARAQARGVAVLRVGVAAASTTSSWSSEVGRVRPGPHEGKAATASGGGGGRGAARSGGRCLRRRPGRPAPLPRAPCIRSPPRPRAATAPSFPSAAAVPPAAAAGAAAAAGTGSPQGRRRRPPSPTRTGSVRVTPR